MRHKIGETLTLGKPLHPLCCTFVLPVGSEIKIIRRAGRVIQGTPRIVLIRHNATGGLHSVKRSAIWSNDECVTHE